MHGGSICKSDTKPIATLSLSTQGGIVLLQLLDWLRMHFNEAYKIAGECVSLEDAADSHPQYWQAVTQFVLQGSIEEARRLLAAHSSRTQPFQLLDQLLKNMPVFTVRPCFDLVCC